MIADHEAVNGRKNFIIIILKDKLNMNGLRREVKTYLQMHTYIDGTNNTDTIPARLRLFVNFVAHLRNSSHIYLCSTGTGFSQLAKLAFLHTTSYFILMNLYQTRRAHLQFAEDNVIESSLDFAGLRCRTNR